MGPPDPILQDKTTPTKWSFNASDPTSAWTSVFTSYPLSAVSGSGTTLELSSTRFWGLHFSNSVNQVMFGNSSPAVPDSKKQSVNDAVLGMVTPSSGALTSPVGFSDILQKFGIPSPAANAQDALSSFIKAVNPVGSQNPNGSLALTLNKATATRNALWLVADDFDQVVVSLSFDSQGGTILSDFQTFLNTYFGLQITLLSEQPQFVMRQTTAFSPIPGSSSPVSTYGMQVRAKTATFRLEANFTAEGLSLVLTDTDNLSTSKTLLQRLNEEIFAASSASNTTASIASNALLGAGDSILADISFWYVEIGKVTGVPDVGTFCDVGVTGTVQLGSSSGKQLVGLVYDTLQPTFSGQLLFTHNLPTPDTKRRWDYTTTMAALANKSALAKPDLDVMTLVGSGVKLPQVPTHITEALIRYQRAGTAGGYGLEVVARAKADTSKTPKQGSGSAPGQFTWDTISVQFVYGTDGTSSTVALNLGTQFDLATVPNPMTSDSKLTMFLQYQSNGPLLLTGSATNIPISKMADYFEPAVKYQAVNALGGLSIRSLDVLYTFDSNGDASSFLIKGILLLGKLELDLYYQYITSKVGSPTAAEILWGQGKSPAGEVGVLTGSTGSSSSWSFIALLGAASPDSSLNEIVQSIAPKAKLPGFIGDIQVSAPSGDAALAKLELTKTATGDLLLIVQIQLAGFDLTFASLRKSSYTKTIFRISADKIPIIDSIPLVKKLPQPFDQLLYLWLDDDTGPASGGISAEDLQTINGQLKILKIPEIFSKKTNNASPGAPIPAIRAGHHFMIVQKGSVVLDHFFGDAASQPALVGPPGASNALQPLGAVKEDEPPTKGDIDLQLPFLSISGLTLQFKSGSLVLELDATMLLGPISFSVIGFDVGLDLTKVKLDHLRDVIANGAISFGIHGLAMSVHRPPLEIGGVFIHDTVAGNAGTKIDRFMGGVSVGFEAWQFAAVGAYEVITAGNKSYKSVFVYAKLNGPLLTLAFATISGVRLGFGYNSMVRSPTMVELPKFPFLDGSADKGAANDPLKVLAAMNQWVSPKEDSYWAAAGLTLTAFGMLSVTAVLMLGFHDSGVVISIFADGKAQMPPEVEPDKTLFYVELFMMSELNTVDGYFTVQASLAPASHILVPSCRLTGGFALVNWFDPNAHSGDFVFTVGGFHPAYAPPLWYPVPERLGVSFTLGIGFSVIGTAYFALTPKCVMGGGTLKMGYEFGPVSAWLLVALDVFVQFKPLHYTADLSVSVGCAMSINVWFVHVRVSISVGAALHIQGPDPFGGHADVDFYLFSFTIHFGNTKDGPPPLALGPFYDMVKDPGPPPAKKQTSAPVNPAMAQLKFVLTDGIFNDPAPPETSASTPNEFPDTGANTTWLTKPRDFACTIGCDFALTDAKLINDDDPANQSTTPLLTPKGSSVGPKFYSKPMHADKGWTFQSTLDVTVWSLHSDGSKDTPNPDFTGAMIMKNVPTALWKEYDPAADPVLTPNPASLKSPDAPTMSLCMGVSLKAPEASKGDSQFPDFDATVTFGFPLGPWNLPALAPKQTKFEPSSTIYPTQTPDARWTNFASDWTLSSHNGAKVLRDTVVNGKEIPGMLQVVAKSLGWDKWSPTAALEADASATSNAQQPLAPAWMLRAAPPDRFIADVKTQYPVLPRYAT